MKAKSIILEILLVIIPILSACAIVRYELNKGKSLEDTAPINLVKYLSHAPFQPLFIPFPKILIHNNKFCLKSRFGIRISYH